MRTDPPAGFLFVGDPHLSSITPGRRMDASFADTVLDKLEHTRDIAAERNLQVVVLGDLFDRAKDGQLRMLSRLVKLLQSFDRVPLCLVGNHDRAETVLSEGTALELVKASGALTLIEDTAPLAFEMAGQRVQLWGVPHGQSIPTAVAPGQDVAINIMVTHHDLAFDRAYPGALDPFEVENVSIVVNGHMHLARAPVTKGSTTWHNPGNITRMSLDCKDQVPRVWAWRPAAPTALEPVDLRHQADILSLVGRQVDACDPAGDVPAQSEFASLLRDETRLSAGQTEDGALLLEDLAEVFAVREASPGAKALILRLANERLRPGEALAELPPELRGA